MDDREETIRKRAYAIWEEQGRPQGKDRDHWQQACSELEAWPQANGQVDPVSAIGQPDDVPSAHPSPAETATATEVMAAEVTARAKRRAPAAGTRRQNRKATSPE